jgi:hypothetical protein
MKYDLDYFIAKFEAIPEEKWTVKKFERDGKCCALGHCGFRENVQESGFVTNSLTGEGQALRSLAPDIILINDGINDLANYAPTPKQRVLKHLRALKHMEAKDGKED